MRLRKRKLVLWAGIAFMIFFIVGGTIAPDFLSKFLRW